MTLQILTLKTKNLTDFAKARNEMLKKASADWIFFVDTDEIVLAGLKKEIVDVTANPGNKYIGYYIYRKNYLLGKYVGTDKIIRLARKDAGKWTRSVHEVWEIKGNVGVLKNPLIHETASNLYEFIDKINFYSTLHAKENLKEGKKSNLIKIILFPVFKFFQSIIIGRGFVMSMLQSFHSFLAWSKEWKLQND
ncbi:MAG TPA: glycosyltransferase [Patescibacteria group bacterium]|nr:glycosyltransferase [Patescibacteria group bacterium]